MLIPTHAKEPEDQSRLVNTRIEYLYRDAANWKRHNECVVKGRFAEDEKRVILDSLMDGSDFVPSKVGMPETRFQVHNDDDVDTFELYESGLVPTAAKADLDVTASELARRFGLMKGHWLDGQEDA